MGRRKTSTITKKLSSFFKEAVKAPPAPEPAPEEAEEAPHVETADEWEETEQPEEEETTRLQAEAPDILDELNSATQRWKETGESGIHLEAPIPLSERAKKVWDKIAHDVSPKVASALKAKINVVAQTANTKIHEMREAQHARALRQEELRKTSRAPPTPPAPELRTTRPNDAPAANTQPPRTNTPVSAQTPKAPTTEQIDTAIIASWMDVLAKAEEKTTPAEREEIEKLYKQLSQ